MKKLSFKDVVIEAVKGYFEAVLILIKKLKENKQFVLFVKLICLTTKLYFKRWQFLSYGDYDRVAFIDQTIEIEGLTKVSIKHCFDVNFDFNFGV